MRASKEVPFEWKGVHYDNLERRGNISPLSLRSTLHYRDTELDLILDAPKATTQTYVYSVNLDALGLSSRSTSLTWYREPTDRRIVSQCSTLTAWSWSWSLDTLLPICHENSAAQPSVPPAHHTVTGDRTECLPIPRKLLTIVGCNLPATLG